MMKFFTGGYEKHLACQIQHGADNVQEKIQSTLKWCWSFQHAHWLDKTLADSFSLADFQK